ncbi:DNA topoisomerase 3|uniref:DNA topoisomerase n=1 Tax=Dendrosporobacter quercicolus TaxID=146817 RepID=A0A1G9U6N4_9FIRM|nr:DNA topoisomerase 3 [Dendrosporobacter quercicolus]NSL48741.1 DNA topoisomerase 3 [Dendrosporobacter quercicolus DSM 1736]SDM55483.1 DNA topoisomerase-3 [Dendrosporobacter quercicolus]
MRLYIAEKPSMGAEIAKCLPGPLSRRDGYITTGAGVVTWGFGHILRQAEPGEYDEKYMKWRMEDLPIIPAEWKLLIAESCRKQFGIIQQLIGQATEIVHAGDPDREGQLLIDEVLDYIKNDKPVRRILLNALDEKSIKKAIASLRDNQDFFHLKQSALARARADWLIGMNLSRAYTLAAQRAGHRTTLPVGRVKTPTLALVVRRERELADFKPVDYYVIKAEFQHDNGRFTATWKPRDEQAGLDSEGRLIDQAIAAQLLAHLDAADRQGEIAYCQTTEKKEPQRLPLSLSALQVLAGRKFNYDPQTVLDTAQKLYERKLTSYPRSDCDFLPESQHGEAAVILTNLQTGGQADLAAWSAKAQPKLKSRAWNDKKITAHHAIIPTQEKCNPAVLNETERNIYFLIAQAYIAQFYPVHIYQQTKIEVHYAAEAFAVSGRIILEAGWKEVYGVDAEEKKEEDSGALPVMRKGDAACYIGAAADKKATRPPSRFTASTLLAAMKEIHKYVKNPDLKKQLKDVSGIGTEATRATIINELIARGFLQEEKKKKYLLPQPSAYLLIDALPDEMTYPDSTARWESILHSMAGGGESLEAFIQQQTQFTVRLCQNALELRIPLQGEHPCPQCGKGVLQLRTGRNGKFWGCSGYPQCRAAYDDEDGRPKKPDHICPRCKKGELKSMNGKNGRFWGCTKFPACRATYNDKDNQPDIPENLRQVN